jgi:hypothetical protein
MSGFGRDFGGLYVSRYIADCLLFGLTPECVSDQWVDLVKRKRPAEIKISSNLRV